MNTQKKSDAFKLSYIIIGALTLAAIIIISVTIGVQGCNKDSKTKQLTIAINYVTTVCGPGTTALSWVKDENAAGYRLMLNDTDKTSEIIEAGGRMHYIINEELSGTYWISLKALGDGVDYLDSWEYGFVINYIVPIQLVMSTLYFDSFTGTVYWYNAVNASSYVVMIDGARVSPVLYSAEKNRYEYKLTGYGIYVITVVAYGNDSRYYTPGGMSIVCEYNAPD